MRIAMPVAALLVAPLVAAPAQAAAAPLQKVPTATGSGGAVASVDENATAVGLEVLRRGGNAVDAAIATAATLGVTEPFSSGIGGGGYFVYYDARSGRVSTIDGRETGPATMTEDIFIDPADGLPYDFAEARVSGLSVGTPGTLATWEAAARKWGSRSLGSLLEPAAGVADRGFTVDTTFNSQAAENTAVFAQFDPSRELYLPGGAPPAVGSTFRNPELADTYRLIAREGTGVFYRGAIADDIVSTVQEPPVSATPTAPWAYPIRSGDLQKSDLARYAVAHPAPAKARYRGMDVYGMSTSSSGGTVVGETLNLVEEVDPEGELATLHTYLEASALAFADRNRYIGAYTPKSDLKKLASDGWAAQRACHIDPAKAAVKPVAPGDLTASGCTPAVTAGADQEGQSTTNLTVTDRWGNVVEYTLTLEQTGGSGIVVPGRGFLLNNELTDFNFAGTQGSAPDPNLPGPGKRPRSSISPTIILSGGRPFLALGTPGGSTIITTVIQIIVSRVELGMTLPEALAAPRGSQRNAAGITAEPSFRQRYGPALQALGHTFAADQAEIGAATAIEFKPYGGRVIAAAEPARRGGGSAAVVRPGR